MNNIAQYKHIIWDWNGTLLNDGWLFVKVMNIVLKRRKMQPITLESYRKIFGFPVKDYYMKLGFDFERESFENSGLEFIKEYEKNCFKAQLYPKVIPLLNELKKLGILAGLDSSLVNVARYDMVLLENILNIRKVAENKWSIQSTPTFIVNNEIKIKGNQPLIKFEKAFEKFSS